MAKAQEKPKSKPATVEAVVCPTCFRHVQHPKVDEVREKHGLATREYYGWCFGCNRGFLVVQFLKKGKWIIHKWRPSVALGKTGSVRLENNWIEVIPLELPVALTGPGGEYQQGYTPEAIDIAARIGNCLRNITDMCDSLLSLLEKKK